MRHGILVKGKRYFTVGDAHKAAGCQAGERCDGRGCRLVSSDRARKTKMQLSATYGKRTA